MECPSAAAVYPPSGASSTMNITSLTKVPPSIDRRALTCRDTQHPALVQRVIILEAGNDCARREPGASTQGTSSPSPFALSSTCWYCTLRETLAGTIWPPAAGTITGKAVSSRGPAIAIGGATQPSWERRHRYRRTQGRCPVEGWRSTLLFRPAEWPLGRADSVESP